MKQLLEYGKIFARYGLVGLIWGVVVPFITSYKWAVYFGGHRLIAANLVEYVPYGILVALPHLYLTKNFLIVSGLL